MARTQANSIINLGKFNEEFSAIGGIQFGDVFLVGLLLYVMMQSLID